MVLLPDLLTHISAASRFEVMYIEVIFSALFLLLLLLLSLLSLSLLL